MKINFEKYFKPLDLFCKGATIIIEINFTFQRRS